MTFFSGFSLQDEEYLFEKYIDTSYYSVCGFSYGAIKALSFVKKELAKGNRVDRLQLLSPAFFQTKDEKFKNLQVKAYKRDEEKYLENFMKSCFSPYERKIITKVQTSLRELEELLNYQWLTQDLEDLEAKGVVIEVYIGGLDAIVDASSVKDFFTQYSTVTYIKEANHFLQSV